MKRGRKYWKRSAKRKQISSATLATEKPAPVSSKRAHNLVDALFQHFQKWHPQVLQTGKIDTEALSKF